MNWPDILDAPFQSWVVTWWILCTLGSNNFQNDLIILPLSFYIYSLSPLTHLSLSLSYFSNLRFVFLPKIWFSEQAIFPARELPNLINQNCKRCVRQTPKYGHLILTTINIFAVVVETALVNYSESPLQTPLPTKINFCFKSNWYIFFFVMI